MLATPPSPSPLRDRVCVVTGATSGIGRVCALELARQGATVMLTGRDQTRGDAVATEITAAGGAATFVAADFSSLAAVRKFAEAVRDRHPRVDVLVNNAGLISPVYRLTVDGIEETFAVNHLAPFLLTDLLRDRLVAGTSPRVVTVSSEAHRMVKRIDIESLPSASKFRSFHTYGQSKLANIFFTYELHRRFSAQGLTTNCVHPGVVRSGLWRTRRGLLGFLVGLATPFMISEERGAQPLLKLACAPELAAVSGRYFNKEIEEKSSPLSYDTDLATRLWEMSARLVQSA